MFSLGLCWLLSLLTVGIITAGIFNVFTNGEIGIDPPPVRICIGVEPKDLIIALRNQSPILVLKSVLNAP